MSEAAFKRMTVAEFVRWEDGTDTRYELLAGSPVAMAPPTVAPGSSWLGYVPGLRLPSNLAARGGDRTAGSGRHVLRRRPRGDL